VCAVPKQTKPKPSWLKITPVTAKDEVTNMHIGFADDSLRRRLLAREEVIEENGVTSLFLGSPLDLGDTSIYVADLVLDDLWN